MRFCKAKQVKKETINKIKLLKPNGSVGGEVLSFYHAAERVSAIASLSILRLPVVYRLSINIVSTVSYMLYMIVCV